MTSPYLEKPRRTLEQVRADIERKKRAELKAALVKEFDAWACDVNALKYAEIEGEIEDFLFKSDFVSLVDLVFERLEEKETKS